jgi:hypothetical protein
MNPPHMQSINKIHVPSLQPPPSKSFYLIKQYISRDSLIRKNPIICFLSNRPTTSQPNRLITLPNFFYEQINIIELHSISFVEFETVQDISNQCIILHQREVANLQSKNK